MTMDQVGRGIQTPQKLGEQPGSPQQEGPEQAGSDLEESMLKGTAGLSLSCTYYDRHAGLRYKQSPAIDKKLRA